MKNFKRAMVLGMVAVGMISLIGCGQKEEIVTDNAPQKITAEETKEDAVEMVNPYVYCDSIDEAELIIGFDVDAPKSMLDKELESIVVISGDTIELDYGKDDKYISLRKATGSDDISGDFNSYSIEKTYLLGEIEITIKGNDKINLIMWTDSGYSYAIDIPEGVEESQIEDIVKKIK